jgi:replication factor C subunit 1|tara:strand:+ start:9426 stop:9776 length:351 start_codon:yes stop_codon:yes gene_type:complete
VKGLSKKDVDMGPFTAVDKLCSPSANLLSVNDRLNLVFQDSDIIPLFIQENYLHYRPYQARNELHRLELCAKAAALISEGDVMNKSVRARQVRNFPTHHTPPLRLPILVLRRDYSL